MEGSACSCKHRIPHRQHFVLLLYTLLLRFLSQAILYYAMFEGWEGFGYNNIHIPAFQALYGATLLVSWDFFTLRVALRIKERRCIAEPAERLVCTESKP